MFLLQSKVYKEDLNKELETQTYSVLHMKCLLMILKLLQSHPLLSNVFIPKPNQINGVQPFAMLYCVYRFSVQNSFRHWDQKKQNNVNERKKLEGAGLVSSGANALPAYCYGLHFHRTQWKQWNRKIKAPTWKTLSETSKSHVMISCLVPIHINLLLQNLSKINVCLFIYCSKSEDFFTDI